MTASEGEEEFPPPPRRQRRHHRPRGCRAGQRVQRQRLAAARAPTFTTLQNPSPTAVAAAAHAEDYAELLAENKRLQEKLNDSTRKCNELRKRV